MPTYAVYGKVVGSKYLGEFEAKTKEDAIDKASQEEGYVNLCHQCVSECEDAEIEEFTAEQVGP